MPRRATACPPAYREHLVALARAGCSAKALASAFEPCGQTIRYRAFLADPDRREHPGTLTTAALAKASRLRRANARPKVARGIQGRAAAGFAREAGTIPPDASCS